MAPKQFKQAPDEALLHQHWLSHYLQAHTEQRLWTRILDRTRDLLERRFDSNCHFESVLEIGAGSLAQLRHVRHGFGSYIASDRSEDALSRARNLPVPDRVSFACIDGRRLPFADSQFDRLIATHVLEHIPSPAETLAEWARVVKPGAVISLILPCDPGLLWQIGRSFGPRRSAERHGLPYDYLMAREHINSIHNLTTLLSYHFPRRLETWWPARIASPNLNLIMAGHYFV